MKKINDFVGTGEDDKKISLALMAPFVILTIQYFVLTTFNLMSTTNGSIIQLISKICVGLCFLYVFPIVFKRNKSIVLLAYFFSVLVFLINFLIFSSNNSYLIDLIFPFFFMCLPAFLYSKSIYSINILENIMLKASVVIFLFGFLLGLMIFIGNTSVGIYSMSLSYYMLLPTIIYLNKFLSEYSIKYMLLALLSFLVIVALGSRGAILCIFIFLILKLVRSHKKMNIKNFFFLLMTVGFSGLIFINLNKIISSLNEILVSFGVKSRSLQLFLEDETHLSGRESIYASIQKSISENPILGIGIGGDRQIMQGSYAHNLFLEILSNYGIVIGGIVITFFLFKLISSLTNKNYEFYNILIIWISIGFVHLFVSGSYLTDIKFWILIGVLTNSSFKNCSKGDLKQI